MFLWSQPLQRKGVCTLIWLVLGLAWSPGQGAEAHRAAPTIRMQHTAWRAADGAPSPVLALAQTSEGWLWVGTSVGLFRFDGIAFERVEELGGQRLQSTAVSSLASGPSGELWIGYLKSGASRFQGATLRNYGPQDGFPLSSTRKIAVDPAGPVWAAALRGLMRFDGTRWTRMWPQYDSVSDVLVDRSGNVWFVAGKQLLVLPKGEESPHAVAAGHYDDYSTLTEAPDGTVWVADDTAAPRRYGVQGPLPQTAAVPSKPIEPLMFTSDGSAWFMDADELNRSDATAWSGARDVPRMAATQTLTVAEGLSGTGVRSMSMLEDREGSVWIGTSGGLDRLRASRVLPMPPPSESHPVALLPDSGGRTWIGRWTLPLVRTGNPPLEMAHVDGVLVLRRAPDGSVWAAAHNNGLWHITDGRAERLSGPAEWDRIAAQSMVIDSANRPLLGGRGGLFRRDSDGTWVGLSGRDGFPDAKYTPSILHRDAQDRIWAGFHTAMLVVQGPGGTVTLSAKEGLEIDNLLSIETKNGRVWVGGDSGVQLYRDGRFHSLLGEGHVHFHGVSGIVQRANGDLWLHGSEGVTRIDAGEVARFLLDHRHEPRFERLDYHDGLAGSPSQSRFLPTLVEGDDGVLWASTWSGVFRIDADHMPTNPVPPKVVIKAVRTSGQVLGPAPGLSLEPNTTQIQIDYTALSLQVPERVRFRYMIEGLDPAWQDVGVRRSAYYTSLSPGAYRFKVLAANNDGVWSLEPAVLDFRIAPALHQTAAFRLACGAALALCLLWAFRWREKRLAARTIERERLRQAERERIAAELHDTLLQGFYALLLSVQAAMNRITVPSVRAALEAALQRSERLVNAGRDRVAGLRKAAPGIGDLARAIHAAAEDLSRAGPRITVSVRGAAYVPADVQEEVYFIATEAMSNAVRHANASHIKVRLEASARGMDLAVEDDGIGIPPEVLAQGGVEGHWGLRGMRDRAGRFGAALKMRSSQTTGTTVRVRVAWSPSDTGFIPADTVY